MIEINTTKLERGTHTAPVKVNRGGTTFFQQRRVGQKEKPKPVNPERAQEYWDEEQAARREIDILNRKRGKTQDDYDEMKALSDKKEAAWQNYIKADPEWKLYHKAHEKARDKQTVVLDRAVNPKSTWEPNV